MTEPEEMQRPYIVWVDYDSEGWAPNGFVSLDAAIAAITSRSWSGRVVLTQRMVLSARAAEDGDV